VILLDKKVSNNGSPDKAKPFVRRGRKAAAFCNKMARLPKHELLVCSATYETFWTLTLPEQTPSGDYRLQGIIRIGGKEVSKDFTFKLE
jgi:hypothetical protein